MRSILFLTFILIAISVSTVVSFGGDGYNDKPQPWNVSRGLVSPEFQGQHNGLIARWPMWEGGGHPFSVIDGYGNHLAMPGGTSDPVWQAHLGGMGLRWDGTNDYLTAGDKDIYSFVEGGSDIPFTLVADVILEANAAEDSILDKTPQPCQ